MEEKMGAPVATTVTVAVPEMPALAAVIVTTPGATGVNKPFASTVPIAALELVQVKVG